MRERNRYMWFVADPLIPIRYLALILSKKGSKVSVMLHEARSHLRPSYADFV